jgi:hypothetical protein
MYFRLSYIVRDFELRDAEISVSDPAKQIDLVISRRPIDDTNPPSQPNQAVAVATCQRDLPARHHNKAVSSGILSCRRGIVGQVHGELRDMILHTLRLARWKANWSKGGPDPIQWAREFSWSFDGKAWRRVADTLSISLEFGSPIHWTDDDLQFVRTNVLGELDEPLAHQLLREAAVNRTDNLRSSLVLAVAAAEVGFKHFVSKALPDTDWILQKLPSPPLETMLKSFPWSKLAVRIYGKVPSIPESMTEELIKAVKLRNQIVHLGALEGGTKLKRETVDSVLTAVRDLLYFLDALLGQTWAVSNMSAAAVKQLYQP